MDQLDLSLSSADKLCIAKRYAEALCVAHPEIEAVIATGSVVRGNALPSSDVDLWYVAPTGGGRSEITKGIHRGVFIDIEPFPDNDLTSDRILLDAYTLGYLSGAIVLFDRSGTVSALLQELSARALEENLKTRRLRDLAQPIRRNLSELRASAQADPPDQLEACRSSIFALWCLADYLLARDNLPPGGLRVLARLKVHNTDAFMDIVKLQGSLNMDPAEVKHFIHLYSPERSDEPFWIQKIRWMADHGFKDEAFHSLWIMLGLRVKDRDASDTSLPCTCGRWLAQLGWTGSALDNVVHRFHDVIGRYVPQ